MNRSLHTRRGATAAAVVTVAFASAWVAGHAQPQAVATAPAHTRPLPQPERQPVSIEALEAVSELPELALAGPSRRPQQKRPLRARPAEAGTAAAAPHISGPVPAPKSPTPGAAPTPGPASTAPSGLTTEPSPRRRPPLSSPRAPLPAPAPVSSPGSTTDVEESYDIAEEGY